MKKILSLLNLILIGITSYFIFTFKSEKIGILFIFQILICLIFSAFHISIKKLFKSNERNLLNIVGCVIAETQLLSNASFLYFVLYYLSLVSFTSLFVFLSFLIYITIIILTIYR